MTAPLIAVVGRPNVGKSTFYNRLIGGRPALVHDTPGLTRDRRYGEVEYFGHDFRIVDTGGLDPAAEREVIGAGIHRQSLRAIEEADALLFVVDGRAGIGPLDRDVAKRLRETGKPLFLVVNKLDHTSVDANVHEFHELGLGQPYPISAAHGRGVDALLQAIVDRLEIPKTAVEPDPADDEDAAPDLLDPLDDNDDADDGDDSVDGATPAVAPASGDPVEPRRLRGERRDDAEGRIRVAFVGRPNAGKSSLTNRLIGEERSLVHDVAGTTTDPVDSPFTMRGHDYLLIDTAGIRRKAKVEIEIEKIAVSMAIGQIERADVVVLVIDASEGPSEQDARIAGMVEKAGKGLIIALNKSDLIVDDEAADKLRESITDTFHFAPWAATMMLSAARGDGVDRLMDLVNKTSAQARRRISTPEINRFFKEVCEATPPPLWKGRAVRVHYLTQGGVRPPTFLLWANKPDGLSPSYRRMIVNRMRERYGFKGTPLRVIVKAKADPKGTK